MNYNSPLIFISIEALRESPRGLITNSLQNVESEQENSLKNHQDREENRAPKLISLKYPQKPEAPQTIHRGASTDQLRYLNWKKEAGRRKQRIRSGCSTSICASCVSSNTEVGHTDGHSG